MCLLLPLIALAAGPAPAQKTDARKILVQAVEPVGVPEGEARAVEEAIVFDIGRRAGFSAVTSAELSQTMQFSETSQQLGCTDDTECIAEIRRRLEAGTLIAGKLGRLGEEYLLSVNTIDLETSTVGKRANLMARTLDEIRQKVPAAVDELLGTAARAATFTLPKGEELKLAVMPLSARGVEPATADAMSQILSAELNAIEGVSVISRDDIDAMLSKVQVDAQLACTDSVECVVEIGAALGLSKLVTGTVGQIKDTWVISLQLIDTRRAEVQNRVLESFAGDKAELKNAVKLAAYQIAGVDYRAKKGRLDLTFNVAEAELRLGDGKPEQIKANRWAMVDLAPGRYPLRVLADPEEYQPLHTDLYVAPGAANVRSVEVLELPTPWYKTWWFWTITGVVVAGAVTTGSVLGTMSGDVPDTGTGTVVIE